MTVSKRRIVLAASMALCTGLAIAAATASRASKGDRDNQATVAFVQTNLDSNVAGRASVTDPNQQNAWGIAFAPGGPFWVTANYAGLSTLYVGDGSIVPLVVIFSLHRQGRSPAASRRPPAWFGIRPRDS